MRLRTDTRTGLAFRSELQDGMVHAGMPMIERPSPRHVPQQYSAYLPIHGLQHQVPLQPGGREGGSQCSAGESFKASDVVMLCTFSTISPASP